MNDKVKIGKWKTKFKKQKIIQNGKGCAAAQIKYYKKGQKSN